LIQSNFPRQNIRHKISFHFPYISFVVLSYLEKARVLLNDLLLLEFGEFNLKKYVPAFIFFLSNFKFFNFYEPGNFYEKRKLNQKTYGI